MTENLVNSKSFKQEKVLSQSCLTGDSRPPAAPGRYHSFTKL